MVDEQCIVACVLVGEEKQLVTEVAVAILLLQVLPEVPSDYVTQILSQ